MTMIVILAAAAYVLMWLVLRVMGKRELSEVSAFDFIVLIVMGDFISTAVLKEDTSLIAAVVAIATLAILTLALSWTSWRFRRTRPLLDGMPAIVVRDGTPDRTMMRLERLSLDDLLEAARTKGIDDLGNVELAVLEPNGTFSFFTKQ